jgi:hypothetical protein
MKYINYVGQLRRTRPKMREEKMVGNTGPNVNTVQTSFKIKVFREPRCIKSKNYAIKEKKVV